MTIKEKLKQIKFILNSLEGAYKDDKTLTEYQETHRGGVLIDRIIKSLG